MLDKVICLIQQCLYHFGRKPKRVLCVMRLGKNYYHKCIIRHVSVAHSGHCDDGPPKSVRNRLEERVLTAGFSEVNGRWKQHHTYKNKPDGTTFTHGSTTVCAWLDSVTWRGMTTLRRSEGRKMLQVTPLTATKYISVF